jgi:hypothetical protein
MTTTTATDLEPVGEFRRRLRGWLRDNVPRAERGPRIGVNDVVSDDVELADVQKGRDLQRLFFAPQTAMSLSARSQRAHRAVEPTGIDCRKT